MYLRQIQFLEPVKERGYHARRGNFTRGIPDHSTRLNVETSEKLNESDLEGCTKRLTILWFSNFLRCRESLYAPISSVYTKTTLSEPYPSATMDTPVERKCRSFVEASHGKQESEEDLNLSLRTLHLGQ